MSTIRKIQTNQQGIVSIMMTMVIIIIISLIVLGLAQISRREQRQALDTHLSSQAFYAAESGVNDVAEILRNYSGPTIPSKNDCSTSAVPPYDTLDPDVDSANGVSYTCVIVDPTPGSLVGSVGAKPEIFTLKSASGSPLGTITYAWTPGTGNSGTNYTLCPSTTNIANKAGFRPAAVGGWTCPYAALRVDLVSAPAGANRDTLLNNTMTVFLVPSSNGSLSAVNYASGTDTRVVAANCNATVCRYNFSGLGAGPYYSRVTGIYTDGNLNITPTGGAQFADAQVSVDVTGKAQDVLRRIRVALNVGAGNLNEDIAPALMSGDSICKRFYIDLNGAQDDSAGFPGC